MFHVQTSLLKLACMTNCDNHKFSLLSWYIVSFSVLFCFFHFITNNYISMKLPIIYIILNFVQYCTYFSSYLIGPSDHF